MPSYVSPAVADDLSGLPTSYINAGTAVHLIEDAAGGQIRPIYNRSELPGGFADGVARFSSWGASSRNGAPAEFHGQFQAQKEISPPSGFTNIEFRGLGISTTPPIVAEGEEATFGSINGWVAPGANGKSYRFVWHKPRGNAWITYEMFPSDLRTKAEFVSLLQQLTWP